MNIFFLDLDPELCAQYHNDKHVVKMIVESCQLLYTCHWTSAGDTPPPYISSTPNGTGYKPTHRKHPCNIWLRESLDNYLWLLRLAKALVDEYHYRYGEKTHKCEEHLEWLSMVYPVGLVSRGITPPRCAMPEEYKRPDAVDAYRAYYIGAKQPILQYRKRSKPSFLG